MLAAAVLAFGASGCGTRVDDAGERPATTATIATTTIATTGTTGTTAGATTGTTTGTTAGDEPPATESSAAVPPTTDAGSSTTSSIESTTSSIDSAAAVAEITANWETFFLAGTPIPERVALLENGPDYEAALTMRAADPLQAQASADVREVTLTDAEHAHVVYDVLLGETVALPGAEGNALLQDGVWKVTAESFCSLISLGASEPIPGC